jgi:RNA polymerase sigma-70 factor (ECF subfamily)
MQFKENPTKMKKLGKLTDRFNFHDPVAFKKVFIKYHKALCLFAYTYVKDLQKSEDIVQETFTKLWNDKVKIKSEATLKSFLYLCVRNNSLNFIKHEARRKKQTEDYHYLESHSLFEFNAMEADLCGKANMFIEELPLQSKKIMLLALEENSNNEIAKKMNISINTVKAQKYRAYRKLKVRIKQLF